MATALDSFQLRDFAVPILGHVLRPFGIPKAPATFALLMAQYSTMARQLYLAADPESGGQAIGCRSMAREVRLFLRCRS